MASHEMRSLRDAIQSRPGMYLGDVTSSSGSNLAAKSLLVDAVHMRGAKNALLVIAPDQSLCLEDDGDAPCAEISHWTTLGTGKFTFTNKLWSMAPRVAELAIVAAASERFFVRTTAGTVRLEHGVLVARECAPTSDDPKGRIVCRLSPKIFLEPVEPFTLFAWAKDYAATSPTATLSVQAGGQLRSFVYPHGIADLLNEEDACRTRAHRDAIVIMAERSGLSLSVALRFCLTGPKVTVALVNHERAIAGGTHVDGVTQALAELLGSKFATSSFTAIVSLMDPKPSWAGSVTERLTSPGVEAFARDSVLRHAERIIARANGQDGGDTG